MADDDYDDGPDYYEDGDNYFWVEDGYDLADDLAELVVPDPPFDTGEVEWDDLTRFEYWYDIEYDSDGYHDQKTSRRKRKAIPKQPIGPKGKKRRADDDYAAPSKRVKRSEHISDTSQLPPVLFISKDASPYEKDVDPSTLDAFAILPDWRERFKNVETVIVPKATDGLVSRTATLSQDDSEELEDAGPEGSVELEGLKRALQANLSSLGLDGAKVDQTVLLRLAASMMAQSDEAEEIMAELIEGIHAEEEEDGDRDLFSDWVAKSATTTANEVHEETQSMEVDGQDDGIENAQPPTLLGAYTSTPRAEKLSGPHGRKRRADSPNDSKPNERTNGADKLLI